MPRRMRTATRIIMSAVYAFSTVLPLTSCHEPSVKEYAAMTHSSEWEDRTKAAKALAELSQRGVDIAVACPDLEQMLVGKTRFGTDEAITALATHYIGRDTKKLKRYL